MDFFEQLEKGRFGSFELKHQVGPNLLKGLLVSLLIHGSVIASPLVYSWLSGPQEMVVVPKKRRINLIPPPIPPTPPRGGERILPSPPLEKPDFTVPVPVDSNNAANTKLLPKPDDWRKYAQGKADSVAAGDSGSGGDLVYGQLPDVEVDSILDPSVFVAVEIYPQPFEGNPRPEFPELARVSGLGGTVIVNVWVDKRGEVKKWLVMKTDPKGLGFEEEVLKIVPKWKFTPAIQSGKPIGVWVAVPFRFKVEK